MNKAFVFDWSGTLNDNFHCFAQVCALMFRKYGLEPISFDEIRLNFDTPYMKFWNKYLPNQTQAEHHRLYEQFIHQVDEPELYPGVAEVVNWLYGLGYKIIILSSDPASKLSAEIEKSGLESMLLKVVGNTHDKKEAMVALVDEYKLDKKLAYYVGDTAGDVLAGKHAGLKTIGISWGHQHRSLLAESNPDFLIDDILEIKRVISGVI